MPALFHQNLRVFGGGTAQRNEAYTDALGNIANTVNGNNGGGPIWVAGGTEIVNSISAVAGWADLCTALGVNGDAVIACGISALGTREFVGIGVRPGLDVLSRGRVFLQIDRGAVALYHDIEDPQNAQWATLLPAENTPDYRAVVYVIIGAATQNVPPIGVAFLHNAYTNADIRALIAGAVPNIIGTIGSNPVFDGNNPHVFLGGDFNVAPLRRGTQRTGYAYVYSQPITLADLNQLPHGARAGGTTMAGNLYDYWYSDIDPANPVAPFLNAATPPVAGVHVGTLDTGAGNAGPMSDHCASLLRIG